ncbi:MAG: 30S ribosomal protein S20 [Clostridiales bacterium]|nr:30S ribosomal protein S20 [Clostridiales bacterium]MBQ2769250.1 30S ribosomal protein S20 [Clostridia bacterium]
MPNIKSAKKRVLVIEKKTMRNKAVKSALKTQVKKFLTAVEAGDKETAVKLYPETVSAIDGAVTKGVLHKNNANNRKAKLAKKLAALN